MKIGKRIVCILELLALLLTQPVTAFAYDSISGGNEGTVSMGHNTLAGAIDEEGNLWVWGRNKVTNIPCFEDEEDYIAEPVIAEKNIRYISFGVEGVAMIDEDNTLWLSARLPYLLGDEAEDYDGGFVKCLEDVQSVSLGYSVIAAVKTDGSLWMWGKNSDIGNHDEFMKEPEKIMDDVEAVCCQAFCTAILKKDGSLWMWGEFLDVVNLRSYLEYDKPKRVLKDVTSFSLGSTSAAAVTKDGDLWQWGLNGNGAIDPDRNEAILDEPVQTGHGVKAVACSGTTGVTGITAVIEDDGTLRVWGKLNSIEDVDETIDTGVISVSCSSTSLIYLKEDGTVWTWGYGTAIGNGEVPEGQANWGIMAEEPVMVLENALIPAGSSTLNAPWVLPAIIGGAVGLAVIIIVIIILTCRRHKKRRKTQPAQPAGPAQPVMPPTTGYAASGANGAPAAYVTPGYTAPSSNGTPGGYGIPGQTGMPQTSYTAPGPNETPGGYGIPGQTGMPQTGYTAPGSNETPAGYAEDFTIPLYHVPDKKAEFDATIPMNYASPHPQQHSPDSLSNGETKFCIHCGTRNRSDAAFCSKCGARIN